MKKFQLQALIITVVLLNTVPRITNGAQIGDSIGPYKITNITPVPGIPAVISTSDLVYANNSFYTLTYSSGQIVRLSKSGQILQTWQIPDLSQGPDLEIMLGLAFDGTYFYTTARNQGASWRKLTLNSDSSVTVNLKKPWPTGSWPTDLTYADGYLYFPDYLTNNHVAGSITKVNPADLTVVQSFASPSYSIYGLAFDGTNLLANGVGNSGDW
jgi:hypothetical protein